MCILLQKGLVNFAKSLSSMSCAREMSVVDDCPAGGEVEVEVGDAAWRTRLFGEVRKEHDQLISSAPKKKKKKKTSLKY